MKRLYILTLGSLAAALCIFFFKKRTPTTIAKGDGLVIKREWLNQLQNPLTTKNDCRPADQTFLTFPEWYLVFSPEEQANYFKDKTSSSFPYMKHTAQIWESYSIVNNQIKGNFPTNDSYHFMIWVIGSSASVEYSLKALYETLVGRITDTDFAITEEDKFNARFTQDYVSFIKDRPWYEFDFKTPLKSLWTTTSFFDKNFIRKIERKYLLTTELSVKYVYGKLIGIGTKKVYEQALPTTAVIINNNALVNLPRYHQFSKAILNLAKDGNQFKEIAGNNSAILLSVLVPSENIGYYKQAQTIFEQPLASNLSIKRIVIAVPVTELDELLRELEIKKVIIEHVFDY